ncbi:hypothetical protein Hanom_Chr10g00904751 [Helianthus anomalus]
MEKEFKEIIRKVQQTVSILKATMSDKQIDDNAALKQELQKMKIETERVDKKLTSYVAASYVVDHILPKPTGKDEELGRMSTDIMIMVSGIIEFRHRCGEITPKSHRMV